MSNRTGRPRRRPWGVLPKDVIITLSEAADLLCIERESLRTSLYRNPEDEQVQAVRDNGRIVGIRRVK
jgi:hypothetical protein